MVPKQKTSIFYYVTMRNALPTYFFNRIEQSYAEINILPETIQHACLVGIFFQIY